MKFLLICMLLIVTGCSGHGSGSSYLAFDGVSQIRPDAASYIAAHAAAHLSTVYPPGYTALQVDTETQFGKDLETELRKQGYAISDDGIPVGYTVDTLQPDNGAYLSLYLPDGVITQGYLLSKNGAQAFPSFAKQGLEAHPGYVPTVAVVPAPSAIETAIVSIKKTSVLGGTTVSQTVEPLTTPKIEDIPADLPPVLIQSPAPAPTWSLAPGFLRAQLESWAEEAGYQVIWKSKHDYDLSTSAHFEGDFVSSVQELFQQMHEQGNPLRITVYRANSVIEVLEN